MASVLSYRLPPGLPGYVTYADWVMTIKYGKCVHGTRAELGLWFVSISHGINLQGFETDYQGFLAYKAENPDSYFNPFEGSIPEEDHVFFVDEQYARPYWFDKFRRDIDQWKSVCRDFVVGDWDPHYENLWSENTVYSHQLPNGEVVQYGYCPTQSKMNPDRELWFVVLNGHGFIVDKEVAEPSFIDTVGSDIWKWVSICWCHLHGEQEWLFSGIHTIALDSPWSLSEIDAKIAEYRMASSAKTSVQKPTRKKKWWQF